jgi:hypothetical protein
MAADTRCVNGYFKRYTIAKIGAAIVGCSGDAPDCENFIRWMAGKSYKFEWFNQESFDALLLAPTGCSCTANLDPPTIIGEPFYAIGSGSGGPVDVMDLGAVHV